MIYIVTEEDYYTDSETLEAEEVARVLVVVRQGHSKSTLALEIVRALDAAGLTIALHDAEAVGLLSEERQATNLRQLVSRGGIVRIDVVPAASSSPPLKRREGR